MSIEFTCPNCQTTLQVPEEHAGKKAKCPHCQAVVTVQAAGPVPPMKPGESYPPVGQPGPAANPYGTPMGAQGGYPGQSRGEPHRGGLIMTMGILALVCNIMAIPGIMAWTMGKADLAKMNAGLMDREGYGITQAGYIMGIIGTCFALLGLLCLLAYFLIIFLAIAAAAAGGM